MVARFRLSFVAALLGFVLLLATAPKASAITIVRDFIGGSAPVNAQGGGDLASIFNTAADLWEHALLDSWTVTLHFGWAPLGYGILGMHSLMAQSGTPNRETEGRIYFDGDGSSQWFLDPTPTEKSEYTSYAESSRDLGGGLINTGRIYSSPSGAAMYRIDLLTAAFHEIGHSLGLSSANLSFRSDAWDGDIDVSGGMDSGTTIPTISGAHLGVYTALMYPYLSPGARKLPSGLDILANCDISACAAPELHPDYLRQVPEPGTILLLSLGLLGLAMSGKINYRWSEERGSMWQESE